MDGKKTMPNARGSPNRNAGQQEDNTQQSTHNERHFDSGNTANSPNNNNNNTNNHDLHEHNLASFWSDLKFWCFFLFETIIRMLWRLLCLLLTRTKEYFKQSFMSSYLGRFLLKLRELIFNNSLQRQRLLDWLQEVLPPKLVPTNFTSDWENGVLLCALCESIVPGTCPRYELLKALPSMSNIMLALKLVETCFEFRPRIAAEELLENSKNSERKWIQLLSQIRLSHSTQMLRIVQTRKTSLKSSFEKQAFFKSASEYFNDCFIRGTGIVHGVRSRRCCFAIYLNTPFPGNESSLVLHIEILGPNTSYGLRNIHIESEDVAITNNNNNDVEDPFSEMGPHKMAMSNNYHCYKTDCEQTLLMKAIRESSCRYYHIPMFHSVHEGHVRVEYIPIYVGVHTLNIIWKGQHVLGSPFSSNVQSSSYIEHKHDQTDPKMEPGFRYPLSLLPPYSHCDLDRYATVRARNIVQKRIVHRGRDYDFEEYFDKFYSKHTQNADIDRRIIEANTKEDDCSPNSGPQSPTIFDKTSLQSIGSDVDIELLTDSSGSWRLEPVAGREESPSKNSTASSVSSKSLKDMMKSNRIKFRTDLEKLKNTLKLTMGSKKKKDKTNEQEDT